MGLMLYTDSSAFAKQYLNEHMSAETLALISSADRVSASLVTYVEVVSAIARARRQRMVSAAIATAMLDALDGDWGRMVALDVTNTIVHHAAELALTYGLRAYDAVHLASALEWQETVGEQVTFATFDRALHTAAAEAGLLA
jgi:predicted nucleic acid-binding protein